MSKFGFIGPSNTTENSVADDQLTMNWYPEKDEFSGVSALVLNPTPGTVAFVPSAGTANRGSTIYNTRVFSVFSDHLYEIFANGTKTSRGVILDDGRPCSFAAAGDQLAVCSAGSLYVLTISTNAFAIVAAITDVAKVDFCSGFFVALKVSSNTWQFSSPLDATAWDPLDKYEVSVFSGNVFDLIVDHNEVWLLGQLASTVYSLSGNPDDPFSVNPSAGVIEQGSAALLAAVKLDNTIFWLGNDSRGSLIAWRAAGYTPTRVSTHAVELAFQQYARAGAVNDCVAYSYQDQGHSFWVLYFPTADATWVFDAATGLWHQRAFFDANTGVMHAHHSWTHVAAFGKHLVGDWSSGNLYDMSTTLVDDNGALIRRVRRSPAIFEENKRIYHLRLEIYVEPGLGPQPPLTDGGGNPRPPEMNMRASNNGGKTWSNTRTVGTGLAGEYQARAIFRRLGKARNRVYEISVTDPIPWRIADAFVEIEPGLN